MKLIISVFAVAVCLTQLPGGTWGQSLLVSDMRQNKIVKLSLETGELQTVIAEGTYAGAFEYDPVEKEIYWSDMGFEQIKKSDLSGNSVTVVANISATRHDTTDKPREARAVENLQLGGPGAVARVPGMALDADLRMLFYTVNDNNEIMVLHLNNGTKRLLINGTYQTQFPGNIVLDKENKRIYWVAGMYSAQIYSAKYDGSNISTEVSVKSEGEGMLIALTIDQENKILYWADSAYGAFIYSKPLGSREQVDIMYAEYGDMKSIAFLEGNLYVNNLTSSMNETLYFIPAEGGNKTFVDIGDYFPTIFFIIPVDDFDPFRPEVYYELVHTSETTSELVFHCNFSQQVGASTYKTNWFVDDELVTTTSSGSWEDGDVIMDQALTESQIKAAGIATFGITVTCSVEATFAADNVTTSPVSYSKFIGILVTKSPATLAEGESGEVELTLTAPFGCGSQTPADQCKLTIEIVPTQLSTDCNAATLMPSACGTVFESATWNSPVSVRLYGKVTSSYGSFTKSVLLKFRTVIVSFHAMWGNYEISINIKVTKLSAYYQRKRCSSVNDPHLTTFDGRRYEHQYEGVFTLYRHKELPVEVQIQTTQCGGSGIYCNCGVAVRAGQSLYKYSRCNGEYLSCSIGEDMTVTSGTYNTKIVLPTGGSVEVNGWGSLINIQVIPSVRDLENTQGLCGNMSIDNVCSDDFYMRDGTYSPDPSSQEGCNYRSTVWVNELILFSESWRVPEGENLFSVTNTSTLSSWPTSSVFCTCPPPTGASGTPAQPTCTADQNVEVCKSLPGTKPAIKTTCDEETTPGRKRRSASAIKHLPLRRERRGTVVPTWPDGWTETTAQAFCNEYFGNSSSITACTGVPGVVVDNGIQTCLADIFLTGSTDFASYAVEEVTSKCLHEIVSDPGLSETPAGGESVFDKVSVQVCSGDCNGKGTCTNGVCVCASNYGGGDCSIDLTVGPDLARVGRGGLCDTQTQDCDVISAYGETFVQEGAKCKFEKIKVKAEEQVDAGVSPVEAATQSIIHLRCERPAVTGDDSDFVMGYKVSVANPGDVYSEPMGLMVYDSRCIVPTVNGTTFSWTLTGQYCLHQGMCYEDMVNHPSAKCSKCNGGARTWEIDGNCKSAFPVVAVVVGVVGGLVGIVFIAVVAYVCLKKRGKGSIDP